MKRVLTLVAVAGLMNSAAMGSNINISVQQTDGTNAIGPVAPGSVVDYKVVGTLSDAANEGLALIGLSLDFTGGPLTPGNSPPAGASSCAEPMRAFVMNEGITNPDGFGGTVIGSDLIQAGGAQNTIKNTADNAAFPIGTVFTGIAEPLPSGCGPAVILTGSLTVPPETPDGDYFLTAFDIFANVIVAGEDGSGAFWATEAAGANAPTNLMITVAGDVPPPVLVSSIPPFTTAGNATVPAMGTLWRSARNTIRLTFDGALPAAPAAGEILIQELLPNGAFGADLSANGFTFTLENGNTVLRVRDNDTVGDFIHRGWYAIRNTGGWAGVANFEAQFPVQVGDATGDNRVIGADVLTVNSSVACLSNCGDQNRADIDGNGLVVGADVLQANTSVSSFPVPKPTGH